MKAAIEPRPYQPVYWLRLVVRSYQRLLSPVIGKRCIYHPTCSQYAYEALGLHGFWRGSWLAVRRLGRCHPWAQGRYDPVPRVEVEGDE